MTFHWGANVWGAFHLEPFLKTVKSSTLLGVIGARRVSELSGYGCFYNFAVTLKPKGIPFSSETKKKTKNN